MATQGAASGFAGAIMATTGSAVLSSSLSVGFQAIVSRAAVSLANNKGNLSRTMKDLGSTASIKSIATSIVTAGIIAAMPVDVVPALSAQQVKAGVTLTATQQLQANLVRGAIGASVDTAINGGKLNRALFASLQSVGVNEVLGATQGAIGDLTDGVGANNLPVLNMVSHALIGGLAAEATGGRFADGAAAGFATSAAANAGLFKGLTPDQVSRLSKVIGGVAALLAGGDGKGVNAGANIAQSAALNNYLTHAQFNKLIADLKACGSDKTCRDRTQESYYQISLQQEHDLALCGNNLTCQAPHLKELITVAQDIAGITASFESIGGTRIIDNQIWLVQNNALALLKGGTHYGVYTSWAADNCKSVSGAGCYQAFMNDAKGRSTMAGAMLGVGSVAVAAIGGAAVALAPEALISARACAANPYCWNQVGIAVAELAAGDALGGGTLSMTVAAGGRLVLQKGNEVVGLVDDALGQLARVETDIGSLFRASDGALYKLSANGSLVQKSATLTAGGNKNSVSDVLKGAGVRVNEYTPPNAVIAQQTEYTCVAASCRMIAQDYGIIELESKISDLLETTARGTDLLKAASALQQIGVSGAKANGKATFAEVEAAVSSGRSAIVSIQVPGIGNHAVVIDKVANDLVYFRDPLNVNKGSSGAIGISDFKSLFGSAGKLVSF